MTVRYDKATGCSNGPAPGALALRDHWRRTTQLGDKGIFNCRPIRGSGGGFSTHAEGRAVDLACNALNHERRVGDDYANWLIEHSEELQVQQIIWNRRIWRSGVGWKPHTGTSGPHLDHLHVELNRTGAAQVHPLLTGPTEEDDMFEGNDREVLQATRHDAGQAKDLAAAALAKVGNVEKSVAGVRSDALAAIEDELERDRAERANLADLILATGLVDEKKLGAETKVYIGNLDKRLGR